MRRTSFILAVLLALGVFIAGCNGNDEPPLSEETTITLLVEMHLLQGQREAGLDDLPSRSDILEHYGVTEEEFEETLIYYAGRPDRYKQMYSQVMDTLQVERDPDYYEEFEDRP